MEINSALPDAELAQAVTALAALAQTQRLRAFVSSEPRGRYLIYRADFARMNGLLTYLTRHCCEGGACEAVPIDTCSSC